jgi:HD-GYP domain-containing protein (c-di-GMP phosphodiesterase class II)
LAFLLVGSKGKLYQGPVFQCNFHPERDMKNSIADYYRKINHEFLDKAWQDGPQLGFELFYKTTNGGEDPLFLKFGSYDPETREKICNLVASRESQPLYIHENDLIHYYNHFLIANLRASLENGEPYEKILADSFEVGKRILQEYFDSIGSTRILRSLKEVVTIMHLCLSEGKLSGGSVFNAVSRENTHSSHCANSSLLILFFALQLKLPPSEIRELGLGGMLYDIGKKNIPLNILSKKEDLSIEDWQHIRKHPSAGKKILNDMKCYSQNTLLMAAEHHEKHDGSGYPFGLAGNKISFAAQVCAISDVFNALICERNYHDPRSAFETLIEMKNNMPGHFDPKVLISFIKTFALSQK